MKFFNLVMLSIFAIVFTNCKKSKDDPPAPDLVKGLLAFYQFNQSLNDSTGNLPNLTSTQSWNYSLDRHSNISSVNFVGGKLSVPIPGWNANPLTVSVWVYAHKHDVTKYFLGTNDGSIGLFQVNTKLGTAVSHPFTNSATAEGLEKTKYTHLAGVFDGEKIYTYINGELKATKTHSGEPENLKVIELGDINNSKWNGVLDDLRIYNRVLTKEEITLLARY